MSDHEDKDSSSDDEDYVPDNNEESSDEERDVGADKDAKNDSKTEVKKEEVDKIWEDFKADVSKTKTQQKSSDLDSKNVQTDNKNLDTKSANSDSKETKDTITVTKVYDFAGEDVKITKIVDKNTKEGINHLKNSKTVAASSSSPFAGKRKGGLQGILGKMEKRPKISTLEKSKLDWQNYKQEEGIEDELKIYNRGKDGYVEKQLFLNRTDYRQFEKERDMRLGKMGSRR